MAFNLPVFEQIINTVAIETKEVNRIQLADSETEQVTTAMNSCNTGLASYLLWRRPSLKPTVALGIYLPPKHTHC